MTGLLSIAQVATRFGLTLRALRFYEQKGLIAPTRKGRDRLYSEQDVARLEGITKATAMGFTLAEVADVVLDDGSLRITRDQANKQLEFLRSQLTDTYAALDALAATPIPEAA